MTDIEYHWSMKCKLCGTSSQGMATTTEDATAAMSRFTARTCESAHFVEKATCPTCGSTDPDEMYVRQEPFGRAPYTHCPDDFHKTAPSDRRAPVQGTTRDGKRGTIAWSEHVAVWERYQAEYGNDQSAERIAERGGFGYEEIVTLTGAPPTTFSRE